MPSLSFLEAQGGHRSRFRPYLGRRPTPRQASCFLEAARVWPSPRHWSIQDQRRALRRVNQKYVIPTSTKLDFQSSIPERVCDDYFSRIELNAHEGQNEGEIFQTKKAVYQASAERKEDQKAVDAAVLAAAMKVPYMVSYLASNFSLQNGQNPATMKF